MTIESLPASRHNHFNLLRVFAAAAVIVSHSFPLSLGRGAAEPLQNWVGFTLGGAAVTAFFSISGFFIAQSFERCRSLADFLAARALRILPALIVVSLLLALVVGALVSQLAPSAYYSAPDVWLYMPRTIRFFWRQETLPGVFLSNPYPALVNGPLWTLRFEVLCYAGLTIAGLVGLLRKGAFPLCLGAYALCYVAAHVHGSPFPLACANMSFPFALGMAAYVYRDRISYRLWVFALLAAVAVGLTVLHFLVAQAWAVVIAYGCFLFGFARIPWLLPYNRLGDYSYGLYIYGWPVQQLVVELVPGIPPFGLMVLAFCIAVPCAVLSWHFVEGPALKLRSKLFGRPEERQERPIPAAEPKAAA